MPGLAVFWVREIPAATGIPQGALVSVRGDTSPASRRSRARCMRFQVMNVVFRFVKADAGPPEPSVEGRRGPVPLRRSIPRLPAAESCSRGAGANRGCSSSNA